MLILGLIDLPWWLILLLGIFTLIFIYYKYETQHWDYFKNRGIPFYKPMLIFGTLAMYGEKGMAATELEIYAKYRDKKMCGLFWGMYPVLSIWKEEALADVLVKDATNFIDRYSVNGPESISGLMLVNMTGQKWKNTRHEMTPTFTSGKLKSMNVEINRCAKMFAEYLLEKADSGEAIDIKHYTGCFTMDVIASSAFGMRLDSLKEVDSVFVKHAKAVFDFRMDKFDWRVITAFYFPNLAKFLRKLGIRLDMMPEEPEKFFVDVARQAVEMRKSDDDQSRSDFLQLMIRAMKGENIHDSDGKETAQLKGLTLNEILANALLFFAAGYDTTANTLCFLMYSLALNPDIQQRLIDEIDSVVKDKDNVAYSSLQEMPYLEQCIAETLRLYPIAITLNRVAARDTSLAGIPVAKGTIVQIPVMGIQRDPEKYPEPEKFDPDRFSPENKKTRSPYDYLPFGAGPRNCIGMRLAQLELKVAVIHMLKRVTVETCDKTSIPLVFDHTALLRPKNLLLKTVKR